jgi:hypothetical protein
MLDLTTSRSIVENHLEANFTSCFVRYENVGLPPEDKVWLAVFDKQVLSESTGMGELQMMVNGSLIFQIFTPRNIGTAEARTIAQELSDLFANKEVESINFQESVFHGSPGVGDKEIPWYQMNLVIAYTGIMGQELSQC